MQLLNLIISHENQFNFFYSAEKTSLTEGNDKHIKSNFEGVN